MANNSNLGAAKAAKNGEFYTQYADIQKEINAYFDAIDIPYNDAIPSDYDGIMGVPITFVDKYCPEQFEIIGHPHGDYGLELGL